MLRPATPLTILLFGAFGLLVLSIISTPIVKLIPLASFAGIDFGVFGFCKADDCSPIEIGYDTSSLFNDAQSSTFDLPSSTRASLSTILIVHPVAALLTFIMLILAASAHFHSPSHSPRYLLIIFILSILTLVAALLSFLIDVLLFVPHMAWGSYLVLAATILVGISGIISCAMRRTLVSRKARKRRIAENSEMNGENFYNQLGANPPISLNGNPADISDRSQIKKEFASFDISRKEKDLETTSDERIPLTQQKNTDAPENQPLSSRPEIASAPQRIEDVHMNDPYPLPTSIPLQAPHSDSSLNVSNPASYKPGPYFPSAYQHRENNFPHNNKQGVFQRGRGAYGPRGGGYRPQRADNEFVMRPRDDYNRRPRGVPVTRVFRGRGGAPPNYGSQLPSFDNKGDSNLSPIGLRLPDQAQPRYNMYSPTTASVYSTYNPEIRNSPYPVAETPPPLPMGSNGPLFNELSNYREASPQNTQKPSWSPSASSSNYELSLQYSKSQSATPVPFAPQPIKIIPGIQTGIPLEKDADLDYFTAGPRSPADSELSSFTSISQRDVNPKWRAESNNEPPRKAMFHQKIEMKQQHDILFQANPDFTVPVGRGGRGMPRGRAAPRGRQTRRGRGLMNEEVRNPRY
ncbi:pH-response regulator protein palI/RIM9 [Golovinomyces cichoracearum]|uniref:pH-response regulator protein palI/RIM9 n=1 Tax=Golovinomyces cichoracearum TaxID=62708 RepID=A0A420HDF3_9PEZI|nr:pH-response regulator protein palI/RIM9 [Golovinomyces cichoracearum]